MTSKNRSAVGGDAAHVMLGLGLRLPCRRFELSECLLF